MNNVQLSGRLVADAICRDKSLVGEKAPVKFILAVPRLLSKEKRDLGKQDVDLVPCFIWGKPALRLYNTVHKGDRIIIDKARWNVSKYQKNDSFVFVHECEVLHFEYAERRNQDDEFNDEDFERIVADLQEKLSSL